MNGFDAIAAISIAEADEMVIYGPVSKLQTGGGTGSPSLAEIGLDLLWDDGDFIAWDNGDIIGWEA